MTSPDHQTRHLAAQFSRKYHGAAAALPPRGDVGHAAGPATRRAAASSHTPQVHWRHIPQMYCCRALWPIAKISSTCTCTWQSRGRGRAGSLRGTPQATTRLHPHCRKSHAAGSAARRLTSDSTSRRCHTQPPRSRHHNTELGVFVASVEMIEFKIIGVMVMNILVHRSNIFSKKNVDGDISCIRRIYWLKGFSVKGPPAELSTIKVSLIDNQ